MCRILMTPFAGYSNQYSKLISDILRSMGHEVVAATPKGLFPLKVFDRDDIDLFLVYWPNGFYKGSTKMRTLVKALTFLLLKYKLRKITYLMSIENFIAHDTDTEKLDMWVTKTLAAFAESLIFSTESAHQHFVNLFPLFKDKKYHIIPHPSYDKIYCDCSYNRSFTREMLKIPRNATVCLYLGLIRRYKGLNDFIDVFSAAYAPDRYVLICGRFESEAAKKEITDKLSAQPFEVQKNILIHGEFISDNDLPSYFVSSDFFAVNYVKEPANPGSPVLAMGFGLPVYGSSSGCLPEILGLENMYAFHPQSFDSKVNALEKAFSDCSRDKKAKRLIERNEKFHSQGVLSTRYKGVLEGLF